MRNRPGKKNILVKGIMVDYVDTNLYSQYLTLRFTDFF